MQSIVLGGGCFWCIEAVFQQVRGVESIISGYAGGTTSHPTYDTIGDHAEVVKVSYDETVVSLKTILEIFFSVHDPTTPNRQGNDIGEQYRSIIICDESQLDTVHEARGEAQNNWDNPIITEIKVGNTFYEAEDYHQNYFRNHPEATYCQVIINPKLAKFRQHFSDLLQA